MKTIFCAIFFVLTLPIAAQTNFYVFAGASMYGEDAEAATGDGIGWRIGLGKHFRDYIGVEVIYDQAVAISPIPALIDVDEYEIEDHANANTYLSVLGTYAYPFNDRLAVAGKVGFSRYTIDVEFTTEGHEHHEDEDESEHFLLNEDGVELALSGSLIFTTSDKTAVDLSFSKIFGDFGTTAFSLNFRYSF
ncbi:MAG: outer membrane beta-barrel protein [Gammaproteobacteria bacterium]|nr:outer membrane beta-barrel protein [Gammaproteobacteria bacterium]